MGERIGDVMTPRREIYSPTLNDRILAVGQTMRERQFSHCPILADEIVSGVFSESTILELLVYRPAQTISGDTRLRELGDLRSGANRSVSFKFVSASRTTEDVCRDLLVSWHAIRIGAFFVTDDGGEASPLLGMVTEHDLYPKISALLDGQR